MTDAEMHADILRRRAALAASAAAQVAELKARQQSGQQHVGPWAPAARVSKPRPKKARPQTVATFRRRA